MSSKTTTGVSALHVLQLVGGLVVLLSPFLPWVGLGLISVSGVTATRGEALLLTAFGAIIVAVSAASLVSGRYRLPLASLVAAVAALLLCGFYLHSMSNRFGDNRPDLSPYAFVGAGLWACLAGSTAATISSAIACIRAGAQRTSTGVRTAPRAPGTAPTLWIVLAGLAGMAITGAVIESRSYPKAKPATTSGPVGGNAPAPAVPVDTCGDVGKWFVCVTDVSRKTNISDGFGGGRRVGKGSVFLIVTVSISHSSSTSEDTSSLSFDIGDSGGNRYSVDSEANVAAIMGGHDTCGMLGDQIHPQQAIACRLVYYLVKGTPGIHLIVTDGRHETKIGLGESAPPRKTK